MSAAAAASAVSGYKSAATAAPAATKPRAILPAKRKADSEAAPLHDGWAKLPRPAGGPLLKLPPLQTGAGSDAGGKPALERTGTTEPPRLGGGSSDDAANPGALRRTEPSSESQRRAAAAAGGGGAKPVQLLSLSLRRTTADESPRGGGASSDSPRSVVLQDDNDLFGAPRTEFTSYATQILGIPGAQFAEILFSLSRWDADHHDKCLRTCWYNLHFECACGASSRIAHAAYVPSASAVQPRVRATYTGLWPPRLHSITTCVPKP